MPAKGMLPSDRITGNRSNDEIGPWLSWETRTEVPAGRIDATVTEPYSSDRGDGKSFIDGRNGKAGWHDSIVAQRLVHSNARLEVVNERDPQSPERLGEIFTPG